MEVERLLMDFADAVRNNPRMSPYHVSVYVALLRYSRFVGGELTFNAYSRDVMPLAKILKPGTYHRLMGDLSREGYIVYCPSHSPNTGSLVRLVEFR